MLKIYKLLPFLHFLLYFKVILSADQFYFPRLRANQKNVYKQQVQIPTWKLYHLFYTYLSLNYDLMNPAIQLNENARTRQIT